MAYSVTTTELAGYDGRTGESPAERWLPDGHFQAVMKRKCAWSDRNTLVQEIGANGGELYPHNVNTGARAYAANVIGMSKSSQGPTDELIAYDDAIITIFYSTRAPTYFSGKFLYEAIEPYAEYITVDPTGMRWGSGGGTTLDPTDAPGKEVCGFVYVLQFFHCIAVPPAAVYLVDYCNQAAWPSYTMGLTFSAQTLLYKHPSISHTIQLGSLNDYQVIYRLYFRRYGWNRKWRAATSSWEYVYKNGTQVFFHELGDFYSLVP